MGGERKGGKQMGGRERGGRLLFQTFLGAEFVC